MLSFLMRLDQQVSVKFSKETSL